MTNASSSGQSPSENQRDPSPMEGVRAVIFDMDGTLVDSSYDWPTIRRNLGVNSGSIIGELGSLPEPGRTARLAELEAIEAEATRGASIYEGAIELLDLLAERGVPTALVTNNNQTNTDRLLDRFGLRFEVVVTRDSGLWKPSGAPVNEAAHRLGIPPDQCLGVGDSHYDILAARDAGLRAVCMLHDAAARHVGDADLSFKDIPSFVRYLRDALR